jgi:hypothetical protein
MKMKKKLIIGILALLCCTGLAALVYSIHNFIIPDSFGDLASFADKSALAWVEAPTLTKTYAALKSDPTGKPFSEGMLFRDYIAAPLSDRVRFFTRRLEQITGLDIGEAVLTRAFELPAAIALYEIDKGQIAPVCILRVRPGDSIIASLAAKLGAALSGGGGLIETKWKDEAIYSLGGENQTMHFSFVNDVIIVSPVMDLVKLSIRSASLGDARSLPPDWENFLVRHPLKEGTLARIWMRRDFLLSSIPGLALLIPDLARVPTISAALAVKPSLLLEASWNTPSGARPDAVLSEAILRQLPAAGFIMEANANFAGGESWLKSNLFSRTLKEMPKNIRTNLENFFKSLTGDFAIVFDGFDGNRQAAWPSLRIVFAATGAQAARASTEAFGRLETLIASIPGVRTVAARHHNVEYRILLENAQQSPSKESFNPSFARVGELIVIALDEKSMKSAIELSRGAQAHFLDTALAKNILGGEEVAAKGLTHYAFLDAKKTLANAYTHMEAYGFRSGSYSQRDLAAAFRPLLNNGPGFTTLTAVAAREQNYIRATLTPR